MRKMIPSKFIAWIKKLFGHIEQDGNTTEIGGNLEVDGDLNVNGEIPIDLNGFTNIASLLNVSINEDPNTYPRLQYTTDYSRQQVINLIGKYLIKGLIFDDSEGGFSFYTFPLQLTFYDPQHFSLEDDGYFMQLRGVSYENPTGEYGGCLINFYDDDEFNVHIKIIDF